MRRPSAWACPPRCTEQAWHHQRPTIPAFDGLPLADLLEARLKLPVLLDRDVVMLYAHAARVLSLPASGTTLSSSSARG